MRFINHIQATVPPGKMYCADRKYKYSGRTIRTGRFIEAWHDYCRAAVNYYRYVNPPLWLIIKKYYRQHKSNKAAKAEALRRYKIYYGE